VYPLPHDRNIALCLANKFFEQSSFDLALPKQLQEFDVFRRSKHMQFILEKSPDFDKVQAISYWYAN
jgi:hypothetical protein